MYELVMPFNLSWVLAVGLHHLLSSSVGRFSQPVALQNCRIGIPINLSQNSTLVETDGWVVVYQYWRAPGWRRLTNKII